MSKVKKFNKILLLAHHCIGDSLFITTFARSLRIHYPEAQIDVLVDPRGKMVFDNNRDISNMISLSLRPTVKEYYRVMHEYGRYDLVINERRNDRPTIYSLLFGRERLSVLPKPPRRAKFREKITTHRIYERDTREHRMSRMARMLRAIDVPVVPKIVPPHSLLPQNILQKLPEQYLVLHASSSNELKQWPIEHWLETIKRLLERGFHLVLTGAGDRDAKIVGKIISRLGEHPQVVNLQGELKFSEMSALLESSLGFVSTDSGPGHLASGYPIPIISIISVAAASEWAPWPYEQRIDMNRNLWSNRIPIKQIVGNVTVLQSDRQCVPCSGKRCIISDNLYSPCLQDITPERVVEAVLQAVTLNEN